VSAPAPSELPSYRGYRYSAEIISPAIWLYFRFSLCLRDVEELMAERGVAVTYEPIRAWCSTFGPRYAAGLRRLRARGTTPHVARGGRPATGGLTEDRSLARLNWSGCPQETDYRSLT